MFRHLHDTIIITTTIMFHVVAFYIEMCIQKI